MSKIGYIRVSTEHQETARQQEIMCDYQVDRIFSEKISGANKDRPQLKAMLDYVREGDTLYIVKLSITLDTLTARILKLSSDSQSRIEPTPFYSWWKPANGRADPAVAPVAHEISPDHRF